jgi:hypothetical protein
MRPFWTLWLLHFGGGVTIGVCRRKLRKLRELRRFSLVEARDFILLEGF